MAEQNTELERRQVKRLSNQDAKTLTRECIETALVQLLKTKEYGDITISEIVKRAGVSRAAFYRNYQSKDEVVENALHEVLDELLELISVDKPQRELWYLLFSALESSIEPYRLMLKSGMGDYILSQVIARLSSVLAYWAKKDVREPADEMAALCEGVTREVVL